MFIVGAESTDVKRTVWVTWVLVALNLFGFCLKLAVGDPITYGFSLVPAEVTTGHDLVGTKSVKVRTTRFSGSAPLPFSSRALTASAIAR